MAVDLMWQLRRDDEPEPVPTRAICWMDRDIEGSPISVAVRPALIEAESARMLLSSHTLIAGETRGAVLFFQVRIFLNT